MSIPTDTELLNWLDDNAEESPYIEIEPREIMLTWMEGANLRIADGTDIRSAIAAAMAKRRKEEGGG